MSLGPVRLAYNCRAYFLALPAWRNFASAGMDLIKTFPLAARGEA